ncbi:MAG: carboxypeptidase-like regulatory domain-containing protein [Bacteroidetes bacterium]|nr:carboxypeptidase-like regulatory domain-containing protein [Bacteroidota bacterium]
MIKKHHLRLILFILPFIAAAFTAHAQITRISGKVTDVLTNEPIPFCNVLFKGTSNGTTTNFDGMFKLETETPGDSLTAVFLGYIPVSLKVKKGQDQTINFLLKQNKIEIKEAVIYAGENPANIIIKKVIANRDKKQLRKSQLIPVRSLQQTRI